jgi:pimeloyl-ACP methyl ester carboxylesterase
VDLAIHTLPQVLRQYRAHKLPIVVSGHSAGGQLALWVASEITESRRLTRSQRQGLASPAPIAGVLALAPVADLDYGFDEDLGDGAVRALMGGPSKEFPDRYDHVDPLRLTVEEPVVILHGIKDDRVPLEVSRRYARVHQTDLVEIDDIGHFELIDPLHPVYANVLSSIKDLMTGARKRHPHG